MCALAASALAAVCLSAVPVAELQITGKVLYRSTHALPTRGAEVDIKQVFANNPAYLRLEKLKLSKSQGHGQTLFAEADRAAKKALATVALGESLHVITVLGGVTGGEVPVADLTEAVISELPVYCIDGVVHHGSKRDTGAVAQMERQRVLEAIPSYRRWIFLDESDAEYHFLKDEWEGQYLKALRKVVKDEALTAIVEVGCVTSRLAPAADVTDLVIGALEG